MKKIIALLFSLLTLASYGTQTATLTPTQAKAIVNTPYWPQGNTKDNLIGSFFQTLSLNGYTLSISGQNYVVLPSATADKTVTISSQDGCLIITGTYPTFTLTNACPDKTVTATSLSSGLTIGGTYPTLTFSLTSASGGTGNISGTLTAGAIPKAYGTTTLTNSGWAISGDNIIPNISSTAVFNVTSSTPNSGDVWGFWNTGTLVFDLYDYDNTSPGEWYPSGGTTWSSLMSSLYGTGVTVSSNTITLSLPSVQYFYVQPVSPGYKVNGVDPLLDGVLNYTITAGQNIGSVNNRVGDITTSYVYAYKSVQTTSLSVSGGTTGDIFVRQSNGFGAWTTHTASAGSATTYSYTAGTNIALSGNTFSVVASPSFSGTVTASEFIGRLRPPTTITFSVATTTSYTLECGNNFRQTFQGATVESGASVSTFTLNYKDVPDGGQIAINFYKQTTGDITITFNGVDIFSEGGINGVISGNNVTLASATAPVTFGIYIDRIATKYKLMIVQDDN